MRKPRNDPRVCLTTEAAALWIVRIDRELSGRESQILGEWLSESPVHREAFVEAARLWDRMDVLAKLVRPIALHDFSLASSPPPGEGLAAIAAMLAISEDCSYALERRDAADANKRTDSKQS